MIVAFYSPLHGQSGATSNLIAIAAVTALEKGKNILIMQSHFEMNNLENSMVNKPKLGQSQIDLLDDYGIDSLIRNCNLSPLSQEMIEGNGYSFLDGKLHLLPGTKQINREIFNQTSAHAILEVMEKAKEIYDYVFVDLNAGRGILTEQIIEKADRIAVNLCQNKQVMENYFEHPLENKELFYLIGNYDARSRYNMTNLRYLFPEITKKNAAAIEYSVTYRDAVWDAAVLRFFRKYIACGLKDRNYTFIQSVKKASSRMLRKAGEKHG